MRYLLSILIYISTFAVHSQTDSVFILTKLNSGESNILIAPGTNINHCWKYQKGDNLKWANPEFDDQNWQYMNTALTSTHLANKTFENCGWFRLKIRVDSQYIDRPLVFLMNHLGSSEVYLDGKLIIKYGTIHPNDITKDELENPLYTPRLIIFKNSTNHLLAIRYHDKEAMKDFESKLLKNFGFDIRIGDYNASINFLQNYNFFSKAIMFFYFAFFLALAILHLLLWAFYPKNKSNLYYGIFALNFGFVFLVQALLQISNSPDTIKSILKLGNYIPFLYSAALLAMLYTIFYNKILKVLWIWIGLYIIFLIAHAFKIHINYLSEVLTLFVVVEPLRIIVISIIKKKEGAWIIGSGVIISLTFFITIIILISKGKSDFIFSGEGLIGLITACIIMLSTVSIPLSMSAYLARQFAKTNLDLTKKLEEVEILSTKSIEQEKEKQKILAEQNITLEKQVKERTAEIVEQKQLIEEKQKEILDSIRYAKRIQQSLLPSTKFLERILNKRNKT